MKRGIVLTVILLYVSIATYSQSWQRSDSLRQVYLEKVRYDTALVYAEQALQAVKQEYGESDTLYADMLSGIIEIHNTLGNYQLAIDYCIEERDIREKMQGKKHPKYAISLQNLAILYRNTRDLEESELLFTEVLSLINENLDGNPPDLTYCTCINNLGDLYVAMGKYEKAEPLYLEASMIRKELLGVKHPDYATSLDNLGVLYTTTGDYNKAEPSHIEALNIRKDCLGEKHPDYASSLNNLAIFYQHVSNYKSAESLFLEALEIYEEIFGKKHHEYASVLNNLGALYNSLGNYEKAASLTLESLKLRKDIYGKKHPDYAQALNNLAGIYRFLGKYQEAEQMYDEALTIFRDVYGEKHPDYYTSLRSLASILYVQGEIEEAKTLLIQSLNICKDLHGDKHPDYANLLHNVAYLYHVAREYSKAEPYYLESLMINREIHGKTHPNYTFLINHVASLYEAMGVYEKAEPLYLESIGVTRFNIDQYFTFLTEKEKELYFKIHSVKFEIFNTFALKRKQDNPLIVNYVYNNTLRNKGLLLKSNTAMRRAIKKSNDTTLINKYEKWVTVKKELSVLFSLAKVKQQKDPELLEEQANNLEKDLVRGSQSFSNFKKVQQLTWENIRDKLEDNEAAVEIIRFHNYDGGTNDSIIYAALIICPETRDHPRFVVLKSGHDFEDKYLTQYYNSIIKEKNINKQPEEINQLCYRVFWEEIESEIEGKDIVYFCPDGIYHKINVNTIMFPDGKYLCDKKDVILLNSMSELFDRENNQSIRQGSALLVGNPTYSLDKESQIPLTANLYRDTLNSGTDPIYRDFRSFSPSKLPGSQLEVEQIDSLLKAYNWKTSCFTGNYALEEEIKSAGHPQIIHLATHGFFAEEINAENTNKNPMLRSGLMFCGSQNSLEESYDPMDRIEDGILTGYEVSNLDLDSTELVVLSACETGLGEILNGEGVYGLQRAFKIAGADNIIMSLWKVDDNATQIMMRKFYEFWLEGNSRRKAFQMAQDHLRTNTEYEHPYYWGGFVYIGMDSPGKKGFEGYWYLLFILIPIGLVYLYKKK